MWLVAFVKYQWNSGIKSKWNQAAVELKGKVRMGQVQSKFLSESLPKLYDVKSFPTILCFPAGDKSDPNTFEKYEGAITANYLVSWALEKLNGKSIGKSVCTDVNFGVCHENRVSFVQSTSNFCKAIQLPNKHYIYFDFRSDQIKSFKL